MQYKKKIQNINNIDNIDNIKDVEEVKDNKDYSFDASIRPERTIKRFNDGNIRSNLNYSISITSKDYVELISGIDRKVFNKYVSGYYEHLNMEDTKKLLKAINTIMLPQKMHKDLEEFPNIKYVDYDQQEAERQEQKRAYSQRIKEKVQGIRELMGVC